mmetsp:Transcript_45754/g.143126  ORF Transcript_45754/g.143126 Transcript_45754/m.143126 type:complete len:311 (-) Transcript_45754:189-1121(-)
MDSIGVKVDVGAAKRPRYVHVHIVGPAIPRKVLVDKAVVAIAVREQATWSTRRARVPLARARARLRRLVVATKGGHRRLRAGAVDPRLRCGLVDEAIRATEPRHGVGEVLGLHVLGDGEARVDDGLLIVGQVVLNVQLAEIRLKDIVGAAPHHELSDGDQGEDDVRSEEKQPGQPREKPAAPVVGVREAAGGQRKPREPGKPHHEAVHGEEDLLGAVHDARKGHLQHAAAVVEHGFVACAVVVLPREGAVRLMAVAAGHGGCRVRVATFETVSTHVCDEFRLRRALLHRAAALLQDSAVVFLLGEAITEL